MIYKANDGYSATLRSTWTASPADTTMSVTAIPSNLPTIVTSVAGTASEKKFSVTGTSGDSPSNYALTGVTLLSGTAENVSANTSLNILNHEDFFNQYSEIVNENYLRLVDQDDDPATPDAGKTLFYLKDGQAFTKDDAGDVTLITQDIATQAEVATGTEDAKIVTPLAMANVTNSVFNGIQTASDGATVTFDLGNGVYRKHKVTLGGNRTLALSNVLVGQTFIIDLVQDGTGSRTVTWFTTIKWVYGIQPTLTTTASKIDSFGFICTSSGNYQGYIIGQGL